MTHIAINTTLSLPDALAFEFLTVAARGACLDWANVTETENSKAYLAGFVSARFTARVGGSSAVITAREIGIGIERVVADMRGVSPRVRERVLRVLIDQREGQVDEEIADLVVRAVIRPGGRPGRPWLPATEPM